MVRISLLVALSLCAFTSLGQRSQRHERPRKPSPAPVATNAKAGEEPFVAVRTIDDEPFVSTQLKVVPTIELDSGMLMKVGAMLADSIKYPFPALRAGAEGYVILRVLVRADGKLVAGFVRFDTPIFSKTSVEIGVNTGTGRGQLSNYPIRLLAAEAIRAFETIRIPLAAKESLLEYKVRFGII